MNPKVEALMYAIAEHEGWNPPSDSTPEGGSRSYRNHNPGNLRRSPFAWAYLDNFAVFRNDMVGFMALQWDLMQKATGNTITNLGPTSTLRDLIYVYAPPADNNDSEAYLKHVVEKTGLKETITLKEIFSN